MKAAEVLLRQLAPIPALSDEDLSYLTKVLLRTPPVSDIDVRTCYTCYGLEGLLALVQPES